MAVFSILWSFDSICQRRVLLQAGLAPGAQDKAKREAVGGRGKNGLGLDFSRSFPQFINDFFFNLSTLLDDMRLDIKHLVPGSRISALQELLYFVVVFTWEV
jgi:hypothetical protein